MTANDSTQGGYGLIDTETANMVGYYDTEEAALRDVADTARRYGCDSPEALNLALFRYDGPPEEGAIAAGAALVERALASIPA